MRSQKVKPDPDVWIKRINEMMESGDFDWASDFLVDVREEISERERVTQKQMSAIQNIRRSIQ